MFGLRPLLAKLVDDLAWRQTEKLVPKQAKKVCRRLRQRNAHGVVVNRFDSNVFTAYWDKLLSLNCNLQLWILSEEFLARGFVAWEGKTGRRMHELMKRSVSGRLGLYIRIGNWSNAA